MTVSQCHSLIEEELMRRTENGASLEEVCARVFDNGSKDITNQIGKQYLHLPEVTDKD